MIIDDELSYRVIGCAMQVHNVMGPGWPEIIYQRCLAIELSKQGIAHEREKEHTVYYEGIEVGSRRADFVVQGTIIIEIKAMVELTDAHLAQAKNYVHAYGFEKGLLINFGSKRLQYKAIKP